MSKGLRIRKGATIKLEGAAEKIINHNVSSSTYALNPDDFFAMTPKMLLKEGEQVEAGAPLFYAKHDPRIQFVSPVAGTLQAIVRGAKRKILEVVVSADAKGKAVKHKVDTPEKMGREKVIELLLKSGSWPFIRQRPYNIVANPDVQPKALFISAFTTAPLDVDFEFISKNHKDSFQSGIDVLKVLCEDIILGVDASFSGVFEKINQITRVPISGPHPAGNESVQIHHINPLNNTDKVWTIRPEDVINIGLLFETGQFQAQRTVAVAGSLVQKPQYIKTKIGAQIAPMLQATHTENSTPARIINGDVLSGNQIHLEGHLGFYNNVISVIPEGNEYRMFGWMPFKDNNVPSISKTSFSWLFNKPKKANTNLNGEERALVVTGEMEKVFPMEIYPMQLLKACMAGDIEKMEQLGIYEVIPEDFGLIDFANTSKLEAQEIIKDAMQLMIKEVG